MSLLEVKNSYLVYAKMLPDKYENYEIDYLADEFCAATDSGNEVKRNIYCAALMLRFWYQIDNLYKTSYTLGLDREDFAMWLYEAIEYACKYRAWQTKGLNARTCINQCINTIRLQKFYLANLAKSRCSYNTISLDTEISDSENEKTLLDMLADEKPENNSSYDVYSVVQELLSSNKIVEAIIVDNIAYKDVFKHAKNKATYTNEEGEEVKYTEYSTQFWSFKLVQELGKLDENYLYNFCMNYLVEKPQLEAAMTAVVAANNSKKYKMVDSAISSLKTIMLGA